MKEIILDVYKEYDEMLNLVRLDNGGMTVYEIISIDRFDADEFGIISGVITIRDICLNAGKKQCTIHYPKVNYDQFIRKQIQIMKDKLNNDFSRSVDQLMINKLMEKYV
jgi:hypothetical protein